MFNMQVRVFNEDDDENPDWDMTDEEALVFLELADALKYNPSDYDQSDEWNDKLPPGYNGYSVRDNETGKYWTLFADCVYLFDTRGVHFGVDPNYTLENFLIECIRDPILKALAKPTRL